jgi:hypothetical protein
MMAAMRGVPRRLGVGLILVAWVLLGPIAMAFDGCPALMAMCEGPCGILSYLVTAPITLGLVHSIAPSTPPASDPLPAVLAPPAEPPPKRLLSA